MKEVCFVAFVTKGSRTVVLCDRVFGFMVVSPTFTTLSVVPSEVSAVVFTGATLEVRSEVGTLEVLVVPSELVEVMGIVEDAAVARTL